MATEGAYFFVMSGGNRADIIKCRPFQPAIQDQQAYSAYLWVKAYQGFFLLRQNFFDGRPTEWRVIREVQPDDSEPDFFDQAGEMLAAQVENEPPPTPEDLSV